MDVQAGHIGKKHFSACTNKHFNRNKTTENTELFSWLLWKSKQLCTFSSLQFKEKSSNKVPRNKIAKLEIWWKTSSTYLSTGEASVSLCWEGSRDLCTGQWISVAEPRIQVALGTCWLGPLFAIKHRKKPISNRIWDSRAQHWAFIALVDGLGTLRSQSQETTH